MNCTSLPQFCHPINKCKLYKQKSWTQLYYYEHTLHSKIKHSYHTLSKLNQTAKNKKEKELRTNLAEIVGETVIIVNDDNWAVGFFGANRRTGIGLDRDRTQ